MITKTFVLRTCFLHVPFLTFLKLEFQLLGFSFPPSNYNTLFINIDSIELKIIYNLGKYKS